MTWLPVLDLMTSRYFPGFDPERLYQFKRGKDGPVESFRLSGQSPCFNVAGLYWKDPLASLTGASSDKTL